MGFTSREELTTTISGQEIEEYMVSEAPLGVPRQLRVITIGAGASGLNFARQVEQHMENIEHVIYEKNEEVGGTWFENTYPGCTCDLPSHNYQFTWAPNPNWSKFYSPQAEILEYFKSVAKIYGLYKYIKLCHRLTGATWNEKGGIWELTLTNLATQVESTDWCHVLVNGSGILNNWKWPDIHGLHSFQGELMHSAAWNKSYDLNGKVVAVLGSGSSGVQIVPSLQPIVKYLITFIRSPTWITAGYAQSKAGPGGSNFEYTADQKRQFRDDPTVYLEYRKEVEVELNSRFKILLKDTPEQRAANDYSSEEMRVKLNHNEPIINKLIPTFPVGCRRSTPGNGYLEALIAPNVRLITESIDRVVPEGILLSTGEVLKVDVFICASGFDISFWPRFPTIGRNEASLKVQWETKPEAYLSLAAENFPNYFMFCGPNAPIGHGSVIPIVEHTAKYIINVLKKMQVQGIRTIAPSAKAVADFNAHIPAFMKRTVWSAKCRSWYKNGKVDGPVIGLHPGSRIHWFHMLDQPRYEDFEYTYLTANRFQYLGNGLSTREEDLSQTAYYFDNPDAGYTNY